RPVDDVPLAHALRSVHRLRHPTCPSARLAALASALTGSPGSRQLPFGPGTRPVSGRLSTAPPWRRADSRPWFPAAFRLPALAFAAILPPPGIPPLLRSAYQRRQRWTATGYHVPHMRDTAGVGAL